MKPITYSDFSLSKMKYAKLYSSGRNHSYVQKVNIADT